MRNPVEKESSEDIFLPLMTLDAAAGQEVIELIDRMKTGTATLCSSMKIPWASLECHSLAMRYCRRPMDSVELLGAGLTGKISRVDIESDTTKSDLAGRSTRTWELKTPIEIPCSKQLQVSLQTLIDDNAVVLTAVCRVVTKAQLLNQ